MQEEEDSICANIEELDNYLLNIENLVAFPKKTGDLYNANLALASDRIKEAFDLVLTHMT